MKFNELDVIKLSHKIEESGLEKGAYGTIVSVYNGGEAYEVEFVNPQGETTALLTLDRSDISSLDETALFEWIEPVWSALPPQTHTEINSVAGTAQFYVHI
jgi:hypothetical protein